MSPNEFRQIIGLKPAQDSSADELRNRNLNKMEGEVDPNVGPDVSSDSSEVSAESTEVDPMETGEAVFKKLFNI